MSDQPEAMNLADVQSVAANIAAARLAQRYTLAGIILALAKTKALDPRDLFDLLRPLADGFAQMGTMAADRVEKDAFATAAEELALLEPLITNLLTIPPGAGRA